MKSKDITTFPFTESFIDNLSVYLVKMYYKNVSHFENSAIVFSGKRPILFLKRSLSRRIGKSFISPKFLTIDEFMEYILRKKECFSSLKELDRMYLIYQLAKGHAPEVLQGRTRFSEFLPWSQEILRFMDQLDIENVNNQQLQNIRDNAQIGYSIPEDINRLLIHFINIRTEYHQYMLKNKLYSRSFQYLRAGQLIKGINLDAFSKIFFCNFFYFGKSQEMVIKDIFDRGQARMFFQGDQRKWPILEYTANKLFVDLKEGEEIYPTFFELHLYKGFDGHTQLGCVRDVLKNIPKEESTVVVLPNADNIIPLLSEIASVTDDFNISLGYPLKRSSVYTLLQNLFRSQISFDNGRYYTKDYLRVIRHPFIKNWTIGEATAVVRILIHKVEEILMGMEKSNISGCVFVSLSDIEQCPELYQVTQDMLRRLNIDVSTKELKDILQEVHTILFCRWEDINNFKEFTSALRLLLDVLVQRSFMRRYPLNMNITDRIIQILDDFMKVSFVSEIFQKEDIFRIFSSKLENEIIAFKGTPLRGLQVLGLYETRSLNFDNVIVMDVNEGVLPRLNLYEPLIPREVMISLGLDRMALEEEIQRYQFMRLISSAKNVYLIYQESKDKQRSRFIEELIWEEERNKKQIGVIKPTEVFFNVGGQSNQKYITKTPKMIEFLRNYKYSASSLNTYLRNPMDFYYSYVLGLREEKNVLEDPNAAQVGIFIHEILEKQFEVFLNKKPNIDDDFCRMFMERLTMRFNLTFGRMMKSDAFLLKSVIVERLEKFLDNERSHKDRCVSEILYIEKYFSESIVLSCGKIRFGFIVDRIDRMSDGTIMIVDYKTGSSDIMPVSLEKVKTLNLSRESIRDNVRSVQLPLYYYFLSQQFPNDVTNALLYNLRTLKLSKFIQKETDDSDKINSVYINILNFIISEILNPEIPFLEDTVRL